MIEVTISSGKGAAQESWRMYMSTAALPQAAHQGAWLSSDDWHFCSIEHCPGCEVCFAPAAVLTEFHADGRRLLPYHWWQHPLKVTTRIVIGE